MKTVAIIGRPNVGKSTLFNRIIGSRKALVHHVPGTTRDRNEHHVKWEKKEFILVDTGGWGDDFSEFSSDIRKQMEVALHGADMIVFVVDGKFGLHPLDGQLNNLLRRLQKTVILVVNKIDSPKQESEISEFYRLGIDGIIPVSSLHGRNISDLLDRIASLISSNQKPSQDYHQNNIKVILAGKPNVGKSSLVNSLCKQERAIVSEKPGTTRDALDITIFREPQNFVLIDTPGLHRKRKITEDMKYLSTLSTHHAMERAEIAVLIVDASIGIGETEAKIADLILKNRLGCLIAINKWDLIEEKEDAVKHFRQQLEYKLQFLWWSKITFISAKTGLRTDKLLSEIQSIHKEFSKVVPKEELRDTAIRAFERNRLSRKGNPVRLKSVEQVGICPPAFTFKVNRPDLVHFSYRRYLGNTLREQFGFTGTPLTLKFIKD